MPQDFHVLASTGYRKRKLTLILRILSLPSLLKRFLELWWLYSCLKSQKTIPGYHSNNCYNRTSIHIMIAVISNYHVTHGRLLKAKIVIC